MKVGSLVECIEDFPLWAQILTDIENVPVRGNIYTIRDVIPNNERIGLHLEEITNIPNKSHNGKEPTFGLRLFREIQPPMEIPETIFNESPEHIVV